MRNGEEVCRRTAKGLCYALGTTATRAECARMPADGAGCFVASTAYLRGGVFLDRGVTIGPACEVKSTIVLDSSRLAHLCFVGDSVVGSDVNLEAGVVVANHVNERPDQKIAIHIGGESIPTGVLKFGALIGDHSRIGANAVLSPGTVLPPHTVVARLGLIDQRGT